MANIKVEDIFKSAIKDAHRIVISTHIYPDADGIGGQAALCMALQHLGKDVICVNEGPLLERYRYLDPHNMIISYDEFKASELINKEIDLFIVVDTNAGPRIGPKMNAVLKKARRILFIDHHPCPDLIKSLHCISTSAAATGELVGQLIESLGIPFTRDMGLALYTAILIDTSSFRYPTVTGHTHRLLGTLLDTGINVPEAYNNIYGTKKIEYTHVLGSILSNAKTSEDEQIAWIVVRDELLKEHNVDPEDTLGFINHLLILDKVKIVCMFRDTGNLIKVSFRSTGKYDVGPIADALGGGGHNHAAATVIEGKLDEVVSDTIQKIQVLLKTSP